MPLLAGTLATNDLVINDVVERVVASDARTVALLGLSFKMDTDDLRESPNVELAERLIGKGFEVRIYDPIVNPSQPDRRQPALRGVQAPAPAAVSCPTPGATLAGADFAIASSRSRCHRRSAREAAARTSSI